MFEMVEKKTETQKQERKPTHIYTYQPDATRTGQNSN